MAREPGLRWYPQWNLIGPDRAVAELRPFLFDVDPDMRAAAATAIAGLRAKPASGVVALTAALDSAPQLESKIKIALALAEYGPVAAPAVPALVRVLKLAQNQGRAFPVIETIAQIGPTAPATDAVVAMVEDSTAFFRMGNDLGSYFERIGPSSANAAPRIVHMVAIGRIAAVDDSLTARAIASMGQPAFDAALKELSRKAAEKGTPDLFMVLAFARTPAAVPVLLRYANAPFDPTWHYRNVDNRAVAITGLGYMGRLAASTVPDLVKLAARDKEADGPIPGESNYQVVEAATQAIHDIRAAQITGQ